MVARALTDTAYLFIHSVITYSYFLVCCFNSSKHVNSLGNREHILFKTDFKPGAVAPSCHPSYSPGRSRKTGSSRLVWAAEEAQDRLRQLRKILFQK